MAKKILINIDTSYGTETYSFPITGDETEEELEEMAREVFWEHCDYSYKVIEDDK